MSDKLTFGHAYKIKAYLYRARYGNEKKWIRYEYKDDHIALYIGYRELFNGKAEYEEDYIAFHPSEHFQAFLFVIHTRSNPVYVLPEDVES